jgi:signal transduction histidine kinase
VASLTNSLAAAWRLVAPWAIRASTSSSRWLRAPQPLAASVDLTLYRIVQEALTNALKHAKATHADVMVCYGADEIRMEVTDDGRGPPSPTAPSAGGGTIGMRERVALFGGELQMGPGRQGGYAVQVCLPIHAEEP